MTDPVLFYSASAALACVLLLGALDKFRDLPGFAAAVSAYEILPAGISTPFALLFALAEVAAGALLLTPAWQPAGAGLALLVLATATAGLAFNLARGRRDMDCGCSGPMSPARRAAQDCPGGWWRATRRWRPGPRRCWRPAPPACRAACCGRTPRRCSAWPPAPSPCTSRPTTCWLRICCKQSEGASHGCLDHFQFPAVGRVAVPGARHPGPVAPDRRAV